MSSPFMSHSRFQKLTAGKQLYLLCYQRYRDVHLNQVAASLAYTTILALVPMFSIATILFSQLSTFINLRESIQIWITSTLIPGGLSDAISRYLTSFSSHSKGLTFFGIAGLLLSAILTLMTIEKAFNQVWQVKQQRTFLMRLMMYVLVTALGPVLLGLSIYITSYFVAASHDLDFGFRYHIELIDFLVPLLITIMPFVVLYKLGPNVAVQWRDALIGGIFAGIVFELAKYGFAFFVSEAQIYKTLYGAFAIVPLFLVWIYLTWWVTMAGAVLAASLPHMREKQRFTQE
jgi:membrane protein